MYHSALLSDCSITEYTITAYPGERFAIPVVAVGQRFGTVPSMVHSKLVLLVISSANVLGDPAVNLIAITVTCSGILPLNLEGIYTNWVLNAIGYFSSLTLSFPQQLLYLQYKLMGTKLLWCTHQRP